jgi:hypothetical protein
MRKLLVMLAMVGLAGGSVFCGSSNSSSGGTSGGSDAGTGGSDAGTDGGSDAGTDAGTDGGSDAGTDGGSDAGTDGGTDAGTDGGTDGGTGGSFATACTSYTTTSSNRFSDCQQATPAFTSRVAASLFTTDYCAETGRAITAGRVAYDDSKARACIAAIQAASCPALETTVSSPNCQAALKGTVANGGACYGDQDCAAGACTGLTCPGTCVAWLAAGAACGQAVAAQCGPGLDCQLNADFVTGTCLATSGAGGACPCNDGLYCDTNRVCQNKKTTGACTGSECALGYACVAGSCRALVGLGSPCTPATGNSAGATECGFMGAYCDPATSRCIEWPVVGQSCAVSLGCKTGYCDFQTTTCADFRTVGQSCAPFQSCVSTAYCDLPAGASTGTCTTRKANGAACTGDGQCQSGDCVIPSGQTQGQCQAACAEP